MGLEPCIDTVNMEGMVALRQLSDSFTMNDLLEAHCTIQGCIFVGTISKAGGEDQKEAMAVVAQYVFCREADKEDDECDDNGVLAAKYR